MKKIILPLVLAAPLLAGCITDGIGPKQGFGTLGGAAAGGLLGSQVGGGTGKLVATGAGVLLGAFLGSEIGASLDRADQVYADSAVQQLGEVKTGRAIRWKNPESGNRGTITPRTLPSKVGKLYCRDFDTTIYIGGRAEHGTGRACEQRDGTWKIVG